MVFFDYFLDRFIQFLAYLFQLKLIKYIENIVNKYRNQKSQNELKVLHHSDNFLVINKPYDMLMNSDDKNVKPTLQTELRIRFPNLINPTLGHEFYFVHRLDYSTSGVVCVALNKQACAAAGNAFQKRTCNKYYVALVRGHLSEEVMDFHADIGDDIREKNGSHKMCSSSEGDFCQEPRTAHTRILLLQTGHYDGEPASKILLKPFTGRRHQLRVHCSLIGHTIVGDYTYSNQNDVKPYRMFLHALRLVVPNQLENLDIQSIDPFAAEDPKNKWKPEIIINNIDEDGFKKVD